MKTVTKFVIGISIVIILLNLGRLLTKEAPSNEKYNERHARIY